MLSGSQEIRGWYSGTAADSDDGLNFSLLQEVRNSPLRWSTASTVHGILLSQVQSGKRFMRWRQGAFS